MKISTNLQSLCSWFQVQSALFVRLIRKITSPVSGLMFHKVFVYRIWHLLLRHVNVTCSSAIQRTGLI
jgi:hypothetical protein